MTGKRDALDTPMMRQYLQTKAEHPDCLLFMRMGDFFELFLDDARQAARILGITLTCRNRGDAQEIPMAGVPWRSLEGHLPKLLAAGLKVAVMDQLEDPKTAKGLVERGLTRIITAGTLIDEDVLPSGSANYLVAMTGFDGPIGIAALDISTGTFTVEEASDDKAAGLALGRLAAAELVLPEELAASDTCSARLAELLACQPPPLGSLPAYAWKPSDGRRLLHERFRIGSLEAFGIGVGDDHLAAAAAAALRYAESRACQDLSHVRRLRRLHPEGQLLIDAGCRRNLELVRNSRDGGRQGSLLQAIDRTCTAPGARLLGQWLAEPLAAVDGIQARHEAVGHLLADDVLRDDLRCELKEVYDLPRLLGRVGTGRCHGRDLVQLAVTLRAAAGIRQRLQADTGTKLPPLLSECLPQLCPAPELVPAIERTLVDEPPLSTSDGGLIRDGVDAELDELRQIKTGAGEWLAAYQGRIAEEAQIPKIKVGYNKVFGYYLEVSKTHASKVPDSFIRKQTLVGAERYITPELKEYEDRALGAEERIRGIEMRLFTALREQACASLPELQECADALAVVDVLAGLAELARLGAWCRPTIDDSGRLELRGARHPVVEQVLGPGRFVANDTSLDADADADASAGRPRLAIITGPNMAGKSTYIRQVALAVVLAQAGSFVPADSARIGIVDRLFSRVGAGDELARGMSTFMVEMAETAAILHHASRRSLVILDEVGRGTSTFDGLSLAWAITEYLYDCTGCRCLFATHYHELTDLASDRPGVVNLSVAISDADGGMAFLHRIVDGPATGSYGLQVARLAGVPQVVLNRAAEVLTTLEELGVALDAQQRPTARDGSGGVQLTLFAPTPSPTLRKLQQLKLDELSPKQALDTLFSLQAAACKE